MSEISSARNNASNALSAGFAFQDGLIDEKSTIAIFDLPAGHEDKECNGSLLPMAKLAAGIGH